MKILLIDIETAPNTAHVWGLWKQNVGTHAIMESSYVMCWAAKWLGEKEVFFDSVFQSSEKKMLKTIHKLISEADAVMHYNGTKFDMPTLNKEFLLNDMAPPAPYKQIDLLKTMRNQFRFPSNKLDYVAQRLGLGSKVQHEGHSLWIRCMRNDPKAWATMEKYNRGDVILLEKVYNVILPWIKNHPNHNLFKKDEDHVCPNCGSKHLQRRGTARTVSGTYQRFQCQVCGTWSRSSKTDIPHTTIKQAA